MASPCAPGTEEGMEADDLPYSRNARPSPRWTRAVEDRSTPIPEEITNELGEIIEMDCGRSMLVDGVNQAFPAWPVSQVSRQRNYVRRERQSGHPAERVTGRARKGIVRSEDEICDWPMTPHLLEAVTHEDRV